MIVQCDKCLTRFKISDDKVRGKVVRIRCARCHQPFTVRGEGPEEKKEPTDKAPDLNDASKLNDPNDGLPKPENNSEAPSSGYNPDNAADFSLGGLEDDPGKAPDTDLSDAARDRPDKPDKPNKIDKDDSTASPLDLSIDTALGEDPSVADPSVADPSVADQTANELPATDEETGGEEPFEGEDSRQGLSMELSSDSVLVDGKEIAAPDSDAPSSDDLDLDPDDDALTSDEFVPEDAQPEDIIEDGTDNDEFDLGIGAGITIDPDLEEGDEKRPFESSIEETLEEGGFGFSSIEPQDDAAEDFTRDIDEFPVMQEDEDPEFKTELPDFDPELDSEFSAMPGSELNLTDTDKTDDGKENSDEPVADKTGGETGTNDFASGFGPEDNEDADDDFDLPEISEPEDEKEDDFGLMEETGSESKTGGDFGVATEATPGNEEVFKGFADEPINDETCEADKASAPFKTRESAPLPEPDEDPAEEPIEANYNPQQHLPFDTPGSPRPEMTFTPRPKVEDPGKFQTGQANTAGKKGASSKWLPLIILAIIVYGGIAALYSTGMIGPPQSRTVEISPIRVERIRGVFIENRKMGRIFTIEGRIRNFSEEPQGISMIRGVLEDGQGRVIAAKKVTPGKIIAREKLKSISRDELRRKLSGISGGSIPPKGSIPIMIIFTKLPKGFAGAGVEVYRR